MLKRFLVFFLISLLSFSLVGCFDAGEVDDFAYVTAIGLDKGKSNLLMLTLQIAKPSAISGGGGEKPGSGEGSESFATLTLDTPSIMSGLNMANNFVSKKMDLSHASLLVISEELAQEGLSNYMYSLPREKQIRPNMFVAISRGTAKDYLESVEPQIVSNPIKYYQLLYSAYKHTGLTANSQLHRFYSLSKVGYKQAVAILADVGRFDSADEFTNEFSTYKEKGRDILLEGDYLAGDAPKEYKSKSEIMGLAVFDGARMVGKLDGQETTYYLMASNQYKNAFITMPDPQEPNSRTILNVSKSRNPKIKVQQVDGKPVINLKIVLEADITSIQSGINYEDPKLVTILEQHYEGLIKEGMYKFLEKTSKEYNSDICGFGAYMKGKFLTWDKWREFNWLDKYKDSTFSVEVDLKIRRPGLTIRMVPIISSGGEKE